MLQFEVDKETSATIEKAWQVIADFGEYAWIPGVDSFELEGSGNG
jgi:carbon monoxide dehydrogenase subunit G